MNTKKGNSKLRNGLAIMMLMMAMTVTAVTGCTSTTAPQNANTATTTQVESSEGGNEAGGEHGSGEGGEGGSEAGGEHGAGAEGSESGGEAGEVSGHPEGGEGGSAELNEAAMSSPITPLDQGWNGVLGDLEVSMQYDAATESVYGTVKNISNQQLCYVQAEPHVKLGQQTIGELGPEKLGNLNPGQQVNSNLSVSGEPGLAGVAYDGYVIHMETFDCSGLGPIPHSGGEGAEGGSEGSGGEGHGPGREGGSESGGEGSEAGVESSSESGGEESGTELALNDTYDAVRNGARLVMMYDAQYNAFVGALENTTNNLLNQVRVEVHLSNGTELGPTTPVDLAPGEQVGVLLPATSQSFDGWAVHAEVGSGEAGGEHGVSGEGNEAGGEHGSSGESGGEHGSSGESGGEDGGGSEGGGG